MEFSWKFPGGMGLKGGQPEKPEGKPDGEKAPVQVAEMDTQELVLPGPQEPMEGVSVPGLDIQNHPDFYKTRKVTYMNSAGVMVEGEECIMIADRHLASLQAARSDSSSVLDEEDADTLSMPADDSSVESNIELINLVSSQGSSVGSLDSSSIESDETVHLDSSQENEEPESKKEVIDLDNCSLSTEGIGDTGSSNTESSQDSQDSQTEIKEEPGLGNDGNVAAGRDNIDDSTRTRIIVIGTGQSQGAMNKTIKEPERHIETAHSTSIQETSIQESIMDAGMSKESLDNSVAMEDLETLSLGSVGENGPQESIMANGNIKGEIENVSLEPEPNLQSLPTNSQEAIMESGTLKAAMETPTLETANNVETLSLDCIQATSTQESVVETMNLDRSIGADGTITEMSVEKPLRNIQLTEVPTSSENAGGIENNPNIIPTTAADEAKEGWMDVAYMKGCGITVKHYYNVSDKLTELKPDTDLTRELEFVKKKLDLQPGTAYKFRVAA